MTRLPRRANSRLGDLHAPDCRQLQCKGCAPEPEYRPASSPNKWVMPKAPPAPPVRDTSWLLLADEEQVKLAAQRLRHLNKGTTMPVEKLKSTKAYKTAKKKGQAAIDKARGKKPETKAQRQARKSSGASGSPYVGSGIIERGKSGVIRGSRRTEDELKKMGQ